VGVLDVGNQIAQARKCDAAAIVLADVDQENGHNIYCIIIYMCIYIYHDSEANECGELCKKTATKSGGCCSVAGQQCGEKAIFQGGTVG